MLVPGVPALSQSKSCARLLLPAQICASAKPWQTAITLGPSHGDIHAAPRLRASAFEFFAPKFKFINKPSPKPTPKRQSQRKRNLEPKLVPPRLRRASTRPRHIEHKGVSGGKKKKTTKRRKVNHARLYCRRSHMTCDEGRPCQRCIKREIGHLCHDEQRQPKHGHGHAGAKQESGMAGATATTTPATAPSTPVVSPPASTPQPQPQPDSEQHAAPTSASPPHATSPSAPSATKTERFLLTAADQESGSHDDPRRDIHHLALPRRSRGIIALVEDAEWRQGTCSRRSFRECPFVACARPTKQVLIMRRASASLGEGSHESRLLSPTTQCHYQRPPDSSGVQVHPV
ncbi:hypothetical protein BJ138DRAFT_1105411 [Hygrophoropsis aurantiaca]|uniref:Uncharacterized protein n=1 Tax=Hygrophoropsis aurantiaca TaxID=72124 RepID=A0ACB7ZZ29_9AGAM|nr:hypothetical protein BJ138DRAFT_1105411 [Hygrophoropsis aurantiaca]